jgi:hypothetical protein
MSKSILVGADWSIVIFHFIIIARINLIIKVGEDSLLNLCIIQLHEGATITRLNGE